MKNRAFTLIELLVVVLIIGILAAIAVPQYQVAVEKSRASSDLPILQALVNARKVYQLTNGKPSCNLEELDVNFKYIDKIETEYKSYQCNVPQVQYTLENGHQIAIGRSADMLVLVGNGYIFDYYTYGLENGRGYCYKGGNNSALGEKVCKALGTPIPNSTLYLLP